MPAAILSASTTLRIIAGQFKGRKLKSPPSIYTRPTSDRLRETLFNVIAARIHKARFLDLCAGSGAVGIEALSRGAAHASFVDRARKMRELILSNLTLCRAPKEQVEVITADAAEFLRKATRDVSSSDKWDIIFFDPPYADDYMPVLEILGDSGTALLADEALIIAEHHHKSGPPETIGTLSRVRLLKQGDSALSFYQR